MSSPLRERRSPRRRNLVSGLLFGIGLAAFVDEVIFHQLLQWHHFYDRSTTSVGLFSDGLFHAFGWFAVVAGLFLFADLRRWHETLLKRWTGGVLLGAGVFQLYDGTVQHKLMGLHQIRYEVDLLVYDTVWNVIAVLLIGAGAFLTYRTRAAVPRESTAPADA
ncbi:DUF2243 domain-containing protein [Arthrobacter sp. zg-Y826]|uniref:DUF2243 domain-containing protein n=1 Tax=Arthrobacter jinronghuae TaxID=2964609 RepID=UPI002105A1B3|nr:DUF2243 domain-containing protein [Arthrobacter jinronghuae]MCQ1956944.1 DUF2243 domain-containing protein [Arthrobacter jinronghuae]